MKILLPLLVLVIGFAIWYFKFRKKDIDKLGISEKYVKQRLSDRGIDPKKYAKFVGVVTTPLGASILVTRRDTPLAALQRYDRGVQRMIHNHTRKYPDKPVPQNVSDYPGAFIEPMGVNTENAPGTPRLIANGAGTAGIVVGTAQGTLVGLPVIVLPHQAEERWRFLDYFEESAYNEAEHSAECRYDRAIFDSFAGYNDVHPHVPDEVNE